MITVHHVDSSGSSRTIWLLEELKLAYQIEHHQADTETGVASSLQDVHVLAKAPILEDDGQMIVGSGAIATYLLNKFDRSGLRPPITSADYIRFQQWISYSDSHLLPLFLQLQRVERLATARVPFFARSILKKVTMGVLTTPLLAEIEQNLNYIEAELSANGWSSGSQFTAADIQISYALEMAQHRNLLPETQFPNIHSFLKTIAERDAYQIALEKSGKRVYALPLNPEPEEALEESVTEERTTA